MKDNITQLPARPQSDDDFLHAAQLMEQMGGSFAASIARAYYVADSSNRARLRAAFPDYFTGFFNVYLTKRNQDT